MRMISLRRLLSKLTVLALASSPAASNADPARPAHACAEEDEADLDSDVPIDREQLDPRDAATRLGRTLAQALAEMRPLRATHLATSWALSEDPLRRAAIANALEWAFPLLGDAAILDHLSFDHDPSIRAAVARGAWVRRRGGGDTGVLARLSHDPDPEVRSIAVRAG
jgi:hypothetical protein